MFKIIYKIALAAFFSITVYANEHSEILKKIDGSYFYPIEHGLSNYCVQIYSPEIQEFLNIKLLSQKSDKIVFKLCDQKGDFTVKSMYQLKDEYKYFEDVIEKIFINKINYISPKPLAAILADYDVSLETKNNITTITGKNTSIVSHNEMIYFVDKQLITKIIFKKSTGTTTIEPTWKKYKWSKGLYVLEHFTVEQREGTQNLKSKIRVSYHDLLKLGLVQKIEITTQQSLINSKNKLKNQDVTRNLKYSILFDQYELGTSSL
jgi:hypothetical protein